MAELSLSRFIEKKLFCNKQPFKNKLSLIKHNLRRMLQASLLRKPRHLKHAKVDNILILLSNRPSQTYILLYMQKSIVRRLKLHA